MTVLANVQTGELISVADVDASILRVIQHAESIWDEWAWQVENQTWTIKGYASWDEMRRAEYGALTSVAAPRAERPELVARFRNAGLTQRETADTLGVSQRTVSNHDAPRQEHPARSSSFATSEPGEVVDAEIVEEPEPRAVTLPRVPTHQERAEQAAAEFPDLAYYIELGDYEHCWRLAETLRSFGPHEIDERLTNLRRSIEVDRSKRAGTYVSPLPQARTCPTCGQTVKD